MDTYFEIIPQEMLISILLYLDKYELQNFIDIFPTMDSEALWWNKLYNDFTDFNLNDIVNYPIHSGPFGNTRKDLIYQVYHNKIIDKYVGLRYSDILKLNLDRLKGLKLLYEIKLIFLHNDFNVEIIWKCQRCGSNDLNILERLRRALDESDSLLVICNICHYRTNLLL